MNKRGEVRLILGHRCAFYPPPNPPLSPPLLFIGGTAQSIDSWAAHLPSLAARRPLLVFETAGQGPQRHDLSDCSLTRHARDVAAVVHAVGWADTPIDLAGFSFGGRVAMAAAAAATVPVRRVTVTSVAARRSAAGRIALRGCLVAARANSLRSFAYQIIAASYSASFLEENESKVNRWVEAVAKSNTCDGLAAILGETLASDEAEHPLHTLRLAERIAAAGTVERGLVIAGGEDAFSLVESSAALASAAGWEHALVDEAGHAVAMEKPRVWREQVLSFLDGS